MKSIVWPLSALLLVGCLGYEPHGDSGVCKPADMKGDLQDLTPAKPKCDAAKGLAGDNLFCVDFSSVPEQVLTTPPPAQLPGWNFEKFANNCWQVLGGKLQVQAFSTFASTCGFLMPAVSPSDYQKYNSFTLSVVQTVDLNTTKQFSWIYLGNDLANQQVSTTTGTNPRQRNITEFAKSALPNGGSGTYQPLFKITSTTMVGTSNAGWQIESIAVMGNP